MLGQEILELRAKKWISRSHYHTLLSSIEDNPKWVRREINNIRLDQTSKLFRWFRFLEWFLQLVIRFMITSVIVLYMVNACMYQEYKVALLGIFISACFYSLTHWDPFD